MRILQSQLRHDTHLVCILQEHSYHYLKYIGGLFAYMTKLIRTLRMVVCSFATMTVLCVTGVAGEVISVAPPESFEILSTGSRIDELVLIKLKQTGMAPSARCTDEVFLRRVYLDVIGTLPTPAEARSFLANRNADKRSKLIDSLLARPEFSEYLGLKWGDLLRVKSEFPCNLWPNAVQAYDRWIRDCIRTNMPYDRFVRELLTSNGSNFRVPQVNFYRAFQDRTPVPVAENVALVFMGMRLRGAGLSNDQILGFSAFFAKVGYKTTDEWKEEIVFFKPEGRLMDAATNLVVLPTPLDGEPLRLKPDQDPRLAFADWLTAPENPWFARNIVNRIWLWLMGRGIIHEPDDLRPDNQPWSNELLEYLEKALVHDNYDLKSIYRIILNSGTYQLDSRPNRWNSADSEGFSHYRIRRLDAEPMLDAINQIFGSGEKYTSSIPEPFTVLPGDQRAIALADGSMESPFLELFGRPARNTSFESERIAFPSVFQAQHMLNSGHIQKKIDNCAELKKLVSGPSKSGEKSNRLTPEERVKSVHSNLVENLYLRVLSRFPDDEEIACAITYLESSKRKPAESACDLAWALINSREFVLRH